MPSKPEPVLSTWERTLASLVILVIQGILPVVTVYLTRNVVNALVAIVQSNGDPAVLKQMREAGADPALEGVDRATLRANGGQARGGCQT